MKDEGPAWRQIKRLARSFIFFIIIAEKRVIIIMKACIRCGRWHDAAEEALGKRLSCTEVKQYWAKAKNEHFRLYGHRAQMVTDDSENWICLTCGRRI